MTSSKGRIHNTLNNIIPDRLPVDFGATSVTGIHCKIVGQLREYYGLEQRPVKVIEPFQMLGEIDEELKKIMNVDCENVFGRTDMLGSSFEDLHEQPTPWGQTVLLPRTVDFTPDSEGVIRIYPQGDRSCEASAVLPEGCYFMNAVERGHDVVDDQDLDPEYNLEEYGYISDRDLDYFVNGVEKAALTGRAVVASFGGAALGDVALIPGASLKNPKGIRNVADWYMSTVLRQDYIHKVFERQIEYAIANYTKLWDRVGSKIDVIFTCGTDFGSQESQFCSADTFDELWLPHYKKMNDWIHRNTTWKTFKHSCGSMVPLLPNLIEAGFDIFNPVQINAKGMDSAALKEKFGRQLVFWGGGVDTQNVLPFGTPRQVEEHVRRQVDIFGADGGFVFNSVHNIQANVPLENVVALIETLNEIRGLPTTLI